MLRSAPDGFERSDLFGGSAPERPHDARQSGGFEEELILVTNCAYLEQKL